MSYAPWFERIANAVDAVRAAGSSEVNEAAGYRVGRRYAHPPGSGEDPMGYPSTPCGVEVLKVKRVIRDADGNTECIVEFFEAEVVAGGAIVFG